MLRLEKIKIKSIRSQAKILGTIATVTGAMAMTLIKGPIIVETFGGKSQIHHSGGTSNQHTILGSVLITIGCFSWACFFNLQVSYSYPSNFIFVILLVIHASYVFLILLLSFLGYYPSSLPCDTLSFLMDMPNGHN
jgi:hypothetical protein